jgi:hypothetical protein
MSHLWKELHERAWNFKGKEDNTFLAQFGRKIPRFTVGCSCKEFWMTYVRLHPPKFGDNGEYFEWTVECHNQVNKKLNKPSITLEQAKAIYSNETK